MLIGESCQTPAKIAMRTRNGRMVILVVAALLLPATFYAGAACYKYGLHIKLRTAWARYTSSDYLKSRLQAKPLPILSIDIKFKHLRQLRDKQQQAVRQGTLLATDDDFVPAKLRFGDQLMSAQLRLKGDMADHWSGDKWSFRIHIKGQDHFLGLRRFSIQHPKTRRFLYEYAYLQSLIREDILAPRFRFVEVLLNGQSKGIYALEEHFSKELPEAQERRDGILLKLDERDQWLCLASTGRWRGLRQWSFDNTSIETYQTGRIDSNSVLAARRDEAIGLLRGLQEHRLPASAVFDVQIMARYMALTELWRVSHGVTWCNCRFYHNPITNRIEPVGYDASPLHEKHAPLVWTEDWRAYLLQDPVMAKAYVQQLLRVCEPGYIDALENDLREEMIGYYGALAAEFGADKELTMPWSELRVRQKFLRSALDPPRTVLAFSHHSQEGAGTNQIIEIRNVLDLPVEIVGLQIAQGPIMSAEEILLAEGSVAPVQAAHHGLYLMPRAANSPRCIVKLALPADDCQLDDATVYVHTRILGHSRVIRTPVTYQPTTITKVRNGADIDLADALQQHDFLDAQADPNELRVRIGTWNVDSDLVIPQGIRLRAKPGTRLRFARDAALISRGALEFSGTQNDPVILEPADENWPGIIVLGVDERSTLEHVVIHKTRGISRTDWNLTGGATFYKSAVLISHSRFSESLAEDALNIVHTEFELHSVGFEHCACDAFDGDYVSGIIEQCTFEGIGCDGVDLSGSSASLINCAFEGVGDKALSAGENSTVSVELIDVSRSRFGMVSKDRSDVYVRQASLSDVEIGLASFIKKPEYGVATLRAEHVNNTHVQRPAMRQSGCTLIIDGMSWPAESIDVAQLYDSAMQRATAHRPAGSR